MEMEALSETFPKEELAELYDLSDATRDAELKALFGRFARARKGDTDKAVTFLKADVEWRRSVGAAGLRRVGPEVALNGASTDEVAQYYERKLLGLDRAGRPVYYQNYRHLIVKKLLALCSLESLEKFHIWEQERAVAVVDELARSRDHPGTMSVVLDVGGMTLRKHVNSDFLKFLKVLASADQNHYPERMGVTLIINAPRAFGVVWSVVKPWLDPKTAEKIKIYASESQWRAAVDDLLGPSIGHALKEDLNLDPLTAPFESPKSVARRLLRGVELPPRIDDDETSSDDDDDDIFHEARSPKPDDEDLARELWIAPIVACGGRLQLGANVDEAAELVEKCVGLQFLAALSVVVAGIVALQSESRRAPSVAILASLASVPFGLLGVAGARRRNPGLLSAHVAACAATATVFFGLAVAFFVVADHKKGNAFFDRTAAGKTMRRHYLALGGTCLICFTFIAAECLVAAKLASRLRRALFSSFQLTTVFGAKAYDISDSESSDDDGMTQLPAFQRGLKSPVYHGDDYFDDEDERPKRWSSFLSRFLFGTKTTTTKKRGKKKKHKKKKPQELPSRRARRLLRKRRKKIVRNMDVADRQFRLALQWCSGVIGGVGIAGLAYGAASTSYFVRRNIGGAALAPYLLIQSSVCLLLVALLGLGIAQPSDNSSHHYYGARERSDLLARVLDLDPRADRLRRMVKRDAQLLFEMRVYRILAVANIALCIVCLCVALSQVVSVATVVKRDGDRRPQVARTASFALVVVSSLAVLACGALLIGLRASTALLVVQKQRRRLRTRQLRAELKKRRSRTAMMMQQPGLSSSQKVLFNVASRGETTNDEDDDDDDDVKDDVEASSMTARFLDAVATRSRRARKRLGPLVTSLRGPLSETRRHHPGFDDLVRHRRSGSFFDIEDVDDDQSDDLDASRQPAPEEPPASSKHSSEVEVVVHNDDDDDDEGKEQQQEEKKNLEDEDTAKMLGLLSEEEPPLAAGLAHLSHGDMGSMLWGLLMGLAHMFLDGTYAIFHVLVTKHGDDGRRRVPWFMVLWRFYGRIDNRYRRAENFVVALNACTALIVGPLCLIFAFVTYERRPSRHALGVIAAVLEIWTTVLYVATETRAGLRDCAPRDSIIFFWLGFVGLTLLRAGLPCPVLATAVHHIADDALIADRWRAVLETRSFGLGGPRRRSFKYSRLPMDVQNDTDARRRRRPSAAYDVPDDDGFVEAGGDLEDTNPGGAPVELPIRRSHSAPNLADRLKLQS